MLCSVCELIKSFGDGRDYVTSLRNLCKHFAFLQCSQSKTRKTRLHYSLDPLTGLKVSLAKCDPEIDWIMQWSFLGNRYKYGLTVQHFRDCVSIIRTDVLDCNSKYTWLIAWEDFIAFSCCESFVSYLEWVMGLKSTQLLWLFMNVHNRTVTGKSNPNFIQELTYLSNIFLLILHISLTLMFIYSRWKCIIAKLITLQISYCTESNYFFFYFFKYSPHFKMFQMKFVDLNKIYILLNTCFFFHLFLRKIKMFSLNFI